MGVTALGLTLLFEGRPVKAQAGVTITWEAENGALESPIIRRNGVHTDKKPGRPGRNSGKGWIEIKDGANGEAGEGDHPGKAIFKVNVPEAGQYTFWARTLWPNGCGNSFWVRLAERPNQLLGEDGTYDVWKWRKVATKLTLAKGVNTIIVANREDGVMMDSCQITTTSVEPQGAIAETQNALVK
ncbi:MAG TPA: hypothetical protein DCZ72_07305 [Armatimonadetes bacterium]|nr:hypothetical protein [Armatimonadota bacterium]